MADSVAAGTSGVPPSPSVITGVSAVTGSRSRYSAMTPVHIAFRSPPGRLTRLLPSSLGRSFLAPSLLSPVGGAPLWLASGDAARLWLTRPPRSSVQSAARPFGSVGSFAFLAFHAHDAVDGADRLHRGQVGHG